MRTVSILLGKSISKASRLTSRGTGSTWPGHIALKIDRGFVQGILKKNPEVKIILVAGTNGKTTTAKLLQEVLENQEKRVFRNAAGANLLNGIASSLIKHSNLFGKINYDFAVFEVDENNLSDILHELRTLNCELGIILLNLFRDQLDRYGEVNTIAKHWKESLKKLAKETVLVVNGDDPMLRFIGEESKLQTYYFGISEKYMRQKEAPHDVDFLFCPHCGTELTYSKRSYSHMGLYKCPKCDFKHVKTTTFDDLPNPMFGIYNRYNINAAALLLQKAFSIDSATVKNTLEKFAPAFGRQEKITYQGKKIFLLLSKNPTGFNQSIEAILESSQNPNVLLLLNDRIPDGRDVSWIWDVDFEELADQRGSIYVGGDRVFDMALRLKYAGVDLQPAQINADLRQAIDSALSNTNQKDTLYILATYSAMLETRKILKGQAIL